MRKAGSLLGRSRDLPEGLAYSVKRRLLGPPLVNEELGEQRLSKPLALGVLSPDGISSSAYGTEEILIELLRGGLGIAAFTVILPITGVVLFVMALVVLSYREVVMVYTRTGGSYVVARENFGPRFAQVAAVALLIDYVVTVAVQVAGGSAAVASAIPALQPYLLEMSVGVIVVIAYLNLRGLKEAGRTFAVPTYLFSASVILMIVIGLAREVFGDLPHRSPGGPGTYFSGYSHIDAALMSSAMIFVMLKAFANGGSSLTGIEAVSNAVGAFRKPEGVNARRVLVIEGCILGFLVAGISWLAHQTHATPYVSGVPTVISQEASLVFGHSVYGRMLFYIVQGATALILYTGGNTSFNGFPFLANFVAEDAFLPRWLTKRGHRLVFSNGIIVLTVVSLALLIAAGSSVNALVPFYAIGVFTGFSIAGFGMAKYHLRNKEAGWRHKLVINASAGVTTAIVVAIFAVTKFTEGAWLVVIVFPVLVIVLIRLNREYRMEARVLERLGRRERPPEPPTYPRRTVYLFVDDFDLATLAALRYARSLRPTTLRAVHFVIDSAQADVLRQDWVRANTGVVLDFIDCPDRRIARAAAELVDAEAAIPGVGVTAILPRRSYSPLLGRLLHDRTADKIAGVVSRIPHAAATIVPFDVRSRLETLHARQAAATGQGAPGGGPADGTGKTGPAGPAPAGRPGPGRAARPLSDSAVAGESGVATRPAGHRALAEEPVRDDEQAPVAGSAAGAVAGTSPGAGPGAAGADASAGAGGGGAEMAPDLAGDAGPGSPGPAGQDGADAYAEADDDAGAGAGAGPAVAGSSLAVSAADSYDRPVPPPGVAEIGSLTKPGRATVEGRIFAVEIRPVERNTVLAAEIADSTGQLTALFYGRSHIPGLDCGARVRFRGPVGLRDGGAVMINPAYELLGHGSVNPPRPARPDGSKPRRGRRPGKEK